MSFLPRGRDWRWPPLPGPIPPVPPDPPPPAPATVSTLDPGSSLDPGIRAAVETLRTAGIETFESCEGGSGHAYPEPTVRFHGDHSEGYRALAVALQQRLPVTALRRVWPVIDLAPTGPWWEMTFRGTPLAG